MTCTYCLTAHVIVLLALTVSLGAETITITQEQASRGIPPYFFGVGEPKIFKIHAERMEYTNEALLALKREMRIRHERGPCGTGANYFLWREGVAMTSRHPDYAAIFGDHLVRMVEATQDQVPRPLSRDLLLHDVDALDIPYIYCLNVFTDSDDEIVASAADLAARMRGRPLFLELGNEVYSIHCQKRFPTVDDYVAFVRRIAPRLRAVIGNGKLSVVGFSPIMFSEMGLDTGREQADVISAQDEERTQAGRVRHWNERLAKASGFFDAVSIHYYNRIRSFDRLPAPADAMAHLFSGNAYYRERMAVLGQIFPGKEVWASEWNVFNVAMLEARDEADKARLNISKHAGTAVVLASLELNMLATGLITLSSPHQFSAANGFGFVNFLDRANRHVKVRLPQFYTRQALGIILERFSMYHPLAVPASQTWNLDPMGIAVRYPAVEAFGFGDNLPRVAVLINTTAEVQSVTLAKHTLRRVWAYGEADPFPRYLQDKPYHWTSAPDDIPMPRTFDESFQAEILVDPYSMTVAEIDVPSGLPLEGPRAGTP